MVEVGIIHILIDQTSFLYKVTILVIGTHPMPNNKILFLSKFIALEKNKMWLKWLNFFLNC